MIFVLFALLFFVGFANAETVTFAWNANSETDLAGYQLFESSVSGGPYTQVGNNITLDLLDDAANPQWSIDEEVGLHYYVLTAFNEVGLVSDYSNEVSVNVIDDTPPAAPSGVTAIQVFVSITIDR